MSTGQQELWMSQATEASDGTHADIERRFAHLVLTHPGAYQIPKLDPAQEQMVSDQALHDTLASHGFPADEFELSLFDRAHARRRIELGHIVRTNLLHPTIQRELFIRRCLGYGSGAPTADL